MICYGPFPSLLLRDMCPVGGAAAGHDVRCWIYHHLDGAQIEGARVL